jgi:intracellular septation protein A
MDNQESVAKRLGLENTDKGYELNRKSLLESIGGPLGIAEAVLPATLFSLAYAFSQEALTAVMLAASSSVIFIIVRLIQRKALTQALVGALAIALAAFLALRDGGQAADYFVPGFITNASYGSVMLVSVLIGRPIMGYIAQLLFGIKDWRQDRPTYRRLRLVTLIWVGFFAARLSVQLPLYFAGLVEALALSRAIMGAPAYAGLLALTWVLLRKIATR